MGGLPTRPQLEPARVDVMNDSKFIAVYSKKLIFTNKRNFPQLYLDINLWQSSFM